MGRGKFIKSPGRRDANGRGKGGHEKAPTHVGATDLTSRVPPRRQGTRERVRR